MCGLGSPVAFRLTAGHRRDVPQAPALIDGLAAQVVLADSAYDAHHFRKLIAGMGLLPLFPIRPSAPASTPSTDRQLYRERHLVDCCFSRLKQFRRVATCYEKTASNYLAVVTLAATILWLR